MCSKQISTHIHTYLGDGDLLLHTDPREDHTEDHDGGPIQTPHGSERGELDRGEEARVEADGEEGDDHVADDLFLRAQSRHLLAARTGQIFSEGAIPSNYRQIWHAT